MPIIFLEYKLNLSPLYVKQLQVNWSVGSTLEVASSIPVSRILFFSRSTTFTVGPAIHRPVFHQKPPVKPRFDWFSPGRLRERSCAPNRPAEALVPVFSGSTGGPVRFLKLCFQQCYDSAFFSVGRRVQSKFRIP
jgi:hypothetical protein